MKTPGLFVAAWAAMIPIGRPGPAAASADDSALVARVRAEYLPALAELEKLYANVDATARRTSRSNIGTAREATKRSIVHFLKAGERMRLVNEPVRDQPVVDPPVGLAGVANDRKPDGPAKGVARPKDSVLCANEKIGFRLVRDDILHPYLVDRLDEDRAPIARQLQGAFGESVNCPMTAGPLRPLSSFRLETFSIDRVVEEDSVGKKLLRVSFSFDLTKTKPMRDGRPFARMKGGAILVSPAEKWIIHAFDLNYVQPLGSFRRVGQIDYSTADRPEPTPSKILIKTINDDILDDRGGPDGGIRPGLVSEEIYEFGKFELGPIPSPDRFQVEDFGIRDLARPAPDRLSPGQAAPRAMD